MARRGAAVLGLLALAGCGPMPLDRAEAFCARQSAPAPSGLGGRAEMGVSSGRLHNGLQLGVDMAANLADPAAAYNACVVRKSGQFPTRPLYAR